MIKIVVDTEEELDVVRRVLESETCSHNTCQCTDLSKCKECVAEYCTNRVAIYMRKIVETPVAVVV